MNSVSFSQDSDTAFSQDCHPAHNRQLITEPFNWTKKAYRAAQLVAENELSITQICKKLALEPPVLKSWKRHPTFAEHVALIIKEFGESNSHRAIARKATRVRHINSLYEDLLEVTQRRKKKYMEDAKLSKLPEAASGLFVMAGEDKLVLDRSMIKTLMEMQKHVAQELGQWTEKLDIKTNKPTVLVLKGFDEREAVGLPPLEVPVNQLPALGDSSVNVREEMDSVSGEEEVEFSDATDNGTASD